MHKQIKLSIWLVVSLVLLALAVAARYWTPDTIAAVTLYKAHLAMLGGWIGYWLDRFIFPNARPGQINSLIVGDFKDFHLQALQQQRATDAACMRRAMIICAALICVGLAA